jgi:valacyclovir hydrolase
VPYIETGDLRVNYEDLGSGTPLLLLGGTIGTIRGDFSKQLDAFGPDVRVIAPERRGYGQTRPPERDYPDNFYQRDADDMAAFMNALGVAPATVLGWSEGADVALCLSVKYPDKVSRLVIWGGISAVTDEDIAIFEAHRDVTKWPQKVCDALTAAYGESYWQTTWWKWCDVMHRLHAQGGDVNLPDLEKLNCPTLIVHGAKDPLIRATHASTLHDRINGSILHLFDDSGHNPHITHAAEFNQLVLDFMGP